MVRQDSENGTEWPAWS